VKPAVWRKAAEHDAADAAYWYTTQGGLALGERFLDAVEAGIAHVSNHPGIGSLRYATALKLEGIRFFPLNGFRYLIFYVEQDSHVGILRVLHAQRDVPAWMQDGES
jgi:toxin ParE1/3/4